MAVVLSFGYIKNQSGDKGSVFWPDLEFNIQRINDHSHNGVNSTRLDSTSIDPITQTVPNTGWASLGDGNFKQTITVLAGVNLYKKVPIIFDALTTKLLNLSCHITSASTYDVWTNDSSLSLKVIYV